jgi:phage terminase Nu1 subunit (DNA packaging protein)
VNPADSQPLRSLEIQARLLTKHDLAKFLGVTPRTVEVYQRHGLPFYRLSARRNRYDLVAVKKWLDDRSRHS